MGALVILNSTISFIESLYTTLGVGTPVTGEVFDTSSSTFREAIETQASAVLSDNWVGTAAEKYSEKSKTLQDAEQIMADVDYITGTLVSDQAEAVEKARKTLKKWINFLEDCKPYAKALYNAVVTIPDSYVFQAAVSAVAMTAVGIALLELLLTTFENAEKLVERIEEIVELLVQLPSDFTEDLAALLEGLLSGMESEISDLVSNVVSDVESEVSQIVSEVKSEVSEV
ncbi:EspA/EspE family type VII secretion system effector, partial [Mycobacterium persicum]